jgi:dTDP-4-amino-4,6-dideoxygalactose transaminase
MIPLANLKAQYQSIKPEIDEAVLSLLESGEYILGSRVKNFEQKFAEYCHNKHAIGTNNGTSALHLALLAAGIGAGDEVITVTMTFIATAAAIAYTGATPVFVDCDPVTWTMDPSKIEQAITPRTKAILPVHLHGRAADMDAICAIAKKHNLLVIEDAAQAHGANYKGRRVGSLANISCFSFYAGKNLGAYGEGGAVVTGNDEYAHKIRILRDCGCEQKYVHQVLGYNYRLEGIQGAILGVKMNYIEAWTQRRVEIASYYNRTLSEAGIQIPGPVPDGDRHVYHVYAIRVENRDQALKQLNTAGIGAGIHYPTPVHLQQAFAHLGHKVGDFPASEQLALETLSLPLFPELTQNEINQICATVIEVCASASTLAKRA